MLGRFRAQHRDLPESQLAELHHAVRYSLQTFTSDSRRPYSRFNTRFHYIPAAIVYPTQTSDVSKAVRCADQWNSTVSALSGGHSYAASGFGSRDGALIVNFRDMKQVNYPGDGTTIVQPGWRLGDLALELNDRGLALAFGNCPEVG